jgi:hypothetical protein
MQKNRLKDSILQQIYVLQELDQAVLLINSGLAVLQMNKPYHRKYFVFLTLLSSGIERLLKIIICLEAIRSKGKFPTKAELKSLSHNIPNLIREVVNRCFTAEYLKRPVAQQDLDFINNNQIINEIITILSDFAKNDRYIFMNGISEPAQSHNWPDRRWEELEAKCLSREEYLELLTKLDIDEITKRANVQLVIHVERFLRAVTRLFVLADLGTEARSKSLAVSHFYKLQDMDLGTKTYTI